MLPQPVAAPLLALVVPAVLAHMAVVLAQNGPVTLWARDKDHAAAIESARFSGNKFDGIFGLDFEQ